MEYREQIKGLNAAVIDSIVFLLREYQQTHRRKADQVRKEPITLSMVKEYANQVSMVNDAQGLVNRIAAEIDKIMDKE